MLRHKKLFMGVGITLGILGVVLLVLGLLLRHEPSFFARTSLPSGILRQQHSKAFYTESARLLSALGSHEAKWHATFSEAQINSYFEEDFINSGVAGKMLPPTISSPRLSIEQEKIRLAFRYGQGFWSTIISVDFRVWMAAKEPNVVVLELQAIHAGALPIAPQPFLEQLSEIIRGPNVDVNWFRYNNHPTAAIQFRSEKDRPSVILRQLDVRPGVLTIVGRSLEPQPGVSAVKQAPAGMAPAAN